MRERRDPRDIKVLIASLVFLFHVEPYNFAKYLSAKLDVPIIMRARGTLGISRCALPPWYFCSTWNPTISPNTYPPNSTYQLSSERAGPSGYQGAHYLHGISVHVEPYNFAKYLSSKLDVPIIIRARGTLGISRCALPPWYFCSTWNPAISPNTYPPNSTYQLSSERAGPLGISRCSLPPGISVPRGTLQLRQILILPLPHLLFLLLALISISHQMQHPVNDHPVKLLDEIFPKPLCIFTHSWDADINLSFQQSRARFCEIERDDIGKSVVVEVLLVDLQQILICTEDIRQRTDL